MKLSRRTRRSLLIAGPPTVIVLVLGWGALPEGPLVVTPPPLNAESGRWVHLEGAANTRDAGGYSAADGRSVRHGMIYRSGKLARLSAAGAEAFRALGVKTVIDFCNRLTPWPLFGGDGWSVHCAAAVRGCPMSFMSGEPADEFYIRGVRDNAASYRKAFELLADEANYPVLYHCRAGTDRTGVMSALLLTLLGVQRDTVVGDFRLSEEVALPGDLHALQALLDRVEAEGGIDAYLDKIGVTEEVRQQVRANLLE